MAFGPLGERMAVSSSMTDFWTNRATLLLFPLSTRSPTFFWMLDLNVMTSLTFTSDSMRAREMSERTALRVSVVSASDGEVWSFWREERSFPPSSARTMVNEACVCCLFVALERCGYWLR